MLVGLAPLAGFTESAFRRLCRKLGAQFTWTELISANFVLNRGLSHPSTHVFPEERPLRFQLQGAEVGPLARAAQKVLSHLAPEGLDLNAGCPARKVVKTGAGAALLADLPRLFEIARTLSEIAHAFGCDFSVKFRLGFERDELERIAETLLEAGVDLLVLHPRTAKEGFSGRARWERIRDLVRLSGERARVYGSGDIRSLSDLQEFFASTGAHGALIGRAALSRPWIFTEWREKRSFEPGLSERLSLLRKLSRYLSAYRDEEGTLRVLKAFAPKFLKGIPHRRRLMPPLLKAKTLEHFWEVLEAGLKEGLIRGEL